MTQANHIVYPLTETVKDTINGYPCEVAVHDSTGSLVGYWAYGYYEPELPYNGESGTTSRKVNNEKH